MLRRFDVLRPARTIQNESRQGAGLANNYPIPVFRKRETPRFCKNLVATVIRSWHSLLENYGQSAWQLRATFLTFLAETWVVIQVRAAHSEICGKHRKLMDKH